MSTLSQHASAVEAFGKVVPATPIVYLASIGDMTIHYHDARVIPVQRPLALKYLAKKTHRLATDEEIKAYDEAAHKAKVESENARQLPISAQTIAQVAMAVANQQTNQVRQQPADTSHDKPVETRKGKGE